MVAQGTNNALGGPLSEGYHRHVVSDAANKASFLPDSNPSTIGQQLTSVFTQATESINAKSPLANITGKDFTNSAALKVNAVSISSGANAGANIASQTASVGAMDNLNQAQGGFEIELAQTQALVMQAMEQSVEALGFDPNEAGKSFMPGPVRSDFGVAATMAASSIAPAAGVYELRSMMAKNLNAQDEIKLAEMVQQSFLPLRGTDGKVIEEARVPNNFDEDMLRKAKPQELVQLFKDIMKPAHEQPEMKAFDKMRSDLQSNLDVHVQKEDLNGAVLSAAEQSGVNVADVHVDEVAIGAAGVEFNELPPAFLVAEASPFVIEPLEIDLVKVPPITTLNLEPLPAAKNDDIYAYSA